MDIDLSGKTAIISASTAGIGLATAKGLAASGAMVVVNGRTSEAVDRVVKLLGAVTKGAKVAGFAADLGDARGCDALVAEHPPL
jgi:NAD(P)-dependent dehydrogenase (short-subunit alcohol dehydrogenase family)